MVQRSKTKILQKGDIDLRANIKRGYLVNKINEQMNISKIKITEIKNRNTETQKTKTIYI